MSRHRKIMFGGLLLAPINLVMVVSRRRSLEVVTIELPIRVRITSPTPTGLIPLMTSPTRIVVEVVDMAIVGAVVADVVMVSPATRTLHSRNEGTCQPLPTAVLNLSVFVPLGSTGLVHPSRAFGSLSSVLVSENHRPVVPSDCSQGLYDRV